MGFVLVILGLSWFEVGGGRWEDGRRLMKLEESTGWGGCSQSFGVGITEQSAKRDDGRILRR